MRFGPVTTFYIDKQITQLTDNKDSQDNQPKPKKRKRIKKNTQITIAAINVRGAKGKIRSMESLLQTEKIQIALITETMFNNKEAYNIKGYKWIGKNRTNKKGGGIGILISNQLTGCTSEANDIEENPNLETTWIKLETRPKNIYIGVFYGPQENNPKDQNEQMYRTLETQIKQLQTKGEVIIGGDFNAKLEVTSEKGKQKQSKNGSLLKRTLDNTNLTPISLEADHGHWTRVNRSNPEEKSIIDYICTTEEVAKNKGITIIDEEGHLRIKGKNETDHNTIITTIKIYNKRKPEYIEKWNTGTKETWKKYNEKIQDKYQRKLFKTQNYKQMEKAILTTMEETVGKTKIRTDKVKKIRNDEIDQLRTKMKEEKVKFGEACKEQNTPENKLQALNEYCRAQRDLRTAIEKQEEITTEARINRLIEKAKTDPNVIWQTRKRNRTNNELEYDTVTEEGITLTDPEETRNYIADRYEELYQARPGTPAYEEWTNKINEKVQEIKNTHNKDENTQGSEPITMKELNKTIMKLRRRKSVGPDNIPNEAFIEADQKTRAIYLEAINHIHTEEEVPETWLEGNIKRLYKGKGVKGKCSNERGITLASNFGKIYERIINERIKPLINITDSQAGGIEGNATVDHLITLKQAIEEIRKEKKTAYIIFLDVKKAYDKAWLDAILYILDKNGVKGKNWEMVRKMNSNLKANIITKFRNTRNIKITDSIRQGGVLSVIEYATMIDEIAKELDSKNLGIEVRNRKIGCLLWMDDVALIHHDKKTLQEMMDCTNDIAMRYHIEFGAEKCKIVRIGRGAQAKIELNNTILEETNKYKYLGEIINNKANLKDHIEELKGKVYAATQKIFTETGHKEFKGIRKRAIWQLVDTCIIPIMTYAAEGWTLTKTETEALQQMFNKVLREILKMPDSTPTTILLMETGYIPIKKIIERKKILQKIRVDKKPEGKLIKDITSQGPWKEEIDQLIEVYHIKDDATKNEAKYMIEQQITSQIIEEINIEALTKSKLKHWKDNTTKITPGKRPQYMNQLTRKQCTAIVKTRSRMLPVKENHKGSHTNTMCRWCANTTETQQHILETCPATMEITEGKLKYEDIFKEENIEKIKSIADTIQKIIEKLETN